jgi:glycolate oxidase iron-sulfur subunit
VQTQLAPQYQRSPEGQEAEAILRKCVHCGFCNATCPTYQLLGDELDGPRGRIYLIKQVLEGAPATRSTQLHLDRCLTCRNCETTCPSGVQYGQLVDIGRKVVEAQVERPREERLVRHALTSGLTSPVFGPAMKLGQWMRPLLPEVLRDKVPAAHPPRAALWPTRRHERRVLLLVGCVQPAMMPNINSATARVLDEIGIQSLVADEAGCCGALRTHLNDHAAGLADMRRNVDAWWPLVSQRRIEAIVMNASGCGVTVREYGRYLAHDPPYAERARRISDLTRDVSELLPEMVQKLRPRLRPRPGKLTYHAPCTLQHGQRLQGDLEQGLRDLGLEVTSAPQESHLCCGSAGTYSVLQPELARALRDRKLEHIAPLAPQAIISSNIGCIQHLQSGTRTPVRHWIEVLDEALASAGP